MTAEHVRTGQHDPVVHNVVATEDHHILNGEESSSPLLRTSSPSGENSRTEKSAAASNRSCCHLPLWAIVLMIVGGLSVLTAVVVVPVVVLANQNREQTVSGGSPGNNPTPCPPGGNNPTPGSAPGTNPPPAPAPGAGGGGGGGNNPVVDPRECLPKAPGIAAGEFEIGAEGGGGGGGGGGNNRVDPRECLPKAPGIPAGEFEIGPFGNDADAARRLRFKAEIRRCVKKPDAAPQADFDQLLNDADAKLGKLIYAFDEGPSKRVASTCSPDVENKTHTYVVRLWFPNAPYGNKKASPYRRKFFNRRPLPEYLADYGLTFADSVMKAVEVDKLGLPAVAAHKLPQPGGDADAKTAETAAAATVSRMLVGHSNAGPGSLALFAYHPDLFHELLLLDPAFCDASARYGLQRAQLEPYTTPADRLAHAETVAAAADDANDTAELFKRMREHQNTPAGPYNLYKAWIQSQWKDTEDGPVENFEAATFEFPGQNGIQGAKALAKSFAMKEFQRQREFLQDNNLPRSKGVALGTKMFRKYLLLGGRFGNALAVTGATTKMQRKLDSTKNRVFRDYWGGKLLESHSNLYKQDSAMASQVSHSLPERSIVVTWGDSLPRPKNASETPNMFDWIPFQASVWTDELKRLAGEGKKLTTLDPIITPGYHVPMLEEAVPKGLQALKSA
ncbi:unnamed protein product [Amoebophrya sp. A120]|nr:unnamed protein product [Amoebophrya sp. A120]|eukprot:GSA120T00013166001.1